MAAAGASQSWTGHTHPCQETRTSTDPAHATTAGCTAGFASSDANVTDFAQMCFVAAPGYYANGVLTPPYRSGHDELDVGPPFTSVL